jgi:hypothetical protein
MLNPWSMHLISFSASKHGHSVCEYQKTSVAHLGSAGRRGCAFRKGEGRVCVAVQKYQLKGSEGRSFKGVFDCKEYRN